MILVNKSNLKKIDTDKLIGITLSVFLIIQSCNIFASSVIENVQILNYTKIFSGILYVIPLLKLLGNSKRFRTRLIYAEILFIVALLFSLLINSAIVKSILSRCIWTVLFCIPMFASAFEIENFDIFLDTMRIPSYIVALIGLILFFNLRADGNILNDTYYMDFGYMLLFPLVYHICSLRKYKINIIFVILEILLVTSLGSRGPLLCVTLYVFFTLFQSKDKKTVNWLISKIGVILLLLLILLFYNNILSIISSFLESFGIRSRTLILLQSGNILYDSGRGEIRKLVLSKIMEKPVLGWGIAGDLNFIDAYPHQIFLELMVHFGIIIGAAISVFIVYKIIRGLYTTRFSNILLMFLCVGIVPLFFSSTYLQYPLAWFAFAMCFNRNIIKIKS